MKRSARITIHPEALQHNLKRAKESAPHAQVNAVIKANAYGHGAVDVAGILYPITDGFAVSCVPEAIELRQAHIDLPLTVLQGPQTMDDLRSAAHHDLRLTLHDKKQLQLLDQYPKTDHAFALNLKIDTGMHRIGFQPEAAPSLFSALTHHPLVKSDALIMMTHLACADDLDNTKTAQQLACFDTACSEITAPKTIANSAGILGWQQTHADWIRPGIMLYGSSPIPQKDRADYQLQAAMTLTAPIIAIHALKKGDSIGYGASWQCPKDMQVAVIACGYADGYPRHAESGTPLWIKGHRVSLVGRVSMDMIVVDIDSIAENEFQVGDLAELWGENINIDDVAKQSETISYELMCHAGSLCETAGS